MESEREKLERQIDALQRVWDGTLDADTPHLADVIAEKRAALAALDGPPDGFVRCESYVLVGADGKWIVWERDTAALGKPHGEYQAWVRTACRVAFTVDVPIPTVQVVRGKVQP